MKTLRTREWGLLYKTIFRPPIAHLPDGERSKLVRGCKGKVIYDSYEEAEPVVIQLPPRPGKGHPHAYTCPLCKGIHIGNTIKKREYPMMASRLIEM